MYQHNLNESLDSNGFTMVVTVTIVVLYIIPSNHDGLFAVYQTHALL